jgi:HEPN domain-containing protein
VGLNENALLYTTRSINKLMNGEVQITDLVISKLLLQNIEEYRSYFHTLQQLLDWTFQELLLVVEIISNMSTQIQIILSHYIESLLLNSYRLKTMTEKYLELLLDSLEAVLSVFGFSSSFYEFKKKKTYHWWDEIYQLREQDIESQTRGYKMGVYRWVYFRTKQRISNTMNTRYLTIVIAL